MPFPEFTSPTTIDDLRSWTAVFDSYDQRNDEVYYLLTLCEGSRKVERFVLQVTLYWAGDDWSGADFVDRLTQELHRGAVTGKTNTDDPGGIGMG